MNTARTPPAPEVASLDYTLPEERIALWPARERDASRLLVVERHGAGLRHRRFGDLLHLLEPGDLLILNDSRVFPARLRGRRDDARAVEVLLTERLDGIGSRAGTERWAVLARTAGRVRAGEVWSLGPGLTCEVMRRLEDGRLEVRLHCAGAVLEAAARHGETPLPPYIRRPVDPATDPHRYQTVYAGPLGSCAAPTAGLHFTPALLSALRSRGVRIASLTLHVGWATFRPLREEEPWPPPVPPESFVLSEATAEAVAAARRGGGRVVAVGTTSARVLEERATAARQVRAGSGRCGLMIQPGHRFRVVDALLTNFHLPRTSLLLLVGSFAGIGIIRAAYEEALRSGYRFYSYGDAMLILGLPGGRGEV
ncbi:MAG: tRNA preQ1(34) S-adenosylmethionine ribosyltransferase-isomerase QueA [Acidobacteriota bacterium]